MTDEIVRRTNLRAQFKDDPRVIFLSKSDAARATAEEMREFQGLLSLWASRLGEQGYTIEAAPLEGPGTMRWIARSPADDAKAKLKGAHL